MHFASPLVRALLVAAWTLALVIPSGLTSIAGSGITVAPFSFSAIGLAAHVPPGGPPAEAHWVRDSTGNWQLFLAKNVPTTEVAAAGAQILGASGLSTTGLTLGFKVTGDCGAGAPRFNVHLSSGTLVFLGCTYGNISGTVSFTAGNSYGGVPFPTGETVASISIVHDEMGSAFLDDITVGSHVVGSPSDNRK